MEVPITVALATLLIGEGLSLLQWSLMIALLIGVFLVSNKHISKIHLKTMERGVAAAVLATIGMGASNFLFGFASRATGPLMINWFTSAFMAAATLGYLLYTGKGGKIIDTWRKNQKLLLLVGFSDNMAWVAYSGAALYMPIGLATGMTESYIALAALLGLFYNKEKLFAHQKWGMALTVAAAIFLAVKSS
jgi:drug/metabolite transporter (DMT)-like permease